jgi:hypothetical protein
MLSGMSRPTSIALIACDVFESELDRFAADAPLIVHRRDLEIGLHDQPDKMRVVLQSEIDRCDALEGLAGVLLLYGLCGRGTAGLRAGRHPLVIPRAHDCITLFLGCRKQFAARACGRCYYYTPGWNRARRVPGPDREVKVREDLAGRFDEDDIEYLIGVERETWGHYDRATFVDLGTKDAEAEADYAASCAGWLGWGFERIRGDETLLRDALSGRWDDERFLVVPPGHLIAHSPDERIFVVKDPGSPG